MKKLKIAVLASNFIRVPPRPKDIPPQCSGAPETMASLITEGLIKRGHEVTLFASGDSKTKGKLVSVTKRATGTDPKIGFNPSRPHVPYENLLISKCYQMAKKGHFDIIHSHFDFPTAFFSPLVKAPTVSTLHSPLSGTRKSILSHFKNSQYYISISDAQRKPLPDLQYAATIYHGINLKKISFSPVSKNYFVFTGRIHPQKGVKEAIEVTKNKIQFNHYGQPRQRRLLEKGN
jgi:glycosyltransferase involved in cell wall biosynthesis